MNYARIIEKKTPLSIKYWIKLTLQYGLFYAMHMPHGSVAEKVEFKS